MSSSWTRTPPRSRRALPALARVLLSGVLATASGCAAAHQLPPAPPAVSGEERVAVPMAAKAAPGTPTTVGPVEYIWGPVYYAASGRECRALMPVAPRYAKRVVCVYRPGEWYLTPVVGTGPLYAGDSS